MCSACLRGWAAVLLRNFCTPRGLDFEVELLVVSRDGERSLGLLPLPDQADGRVCLAIPEQGTLIVHGDEHLACVIRNRSQVSVLTGAYVGVGFGVHQSLTAA